MSYGAQPHKGSLSLCNKEEGRVADANEIIIRMMHKLDDSFFFFFHDLSNSRCGSIRQCGRMRTHQRETEMRR
jgi:hypothetical protein